MAKSITSVWVIDDIDDQTLITIAFKNIDPIILVTLLDKDEAFLNHIQQASPLAKLVLLDLNMPKINGFEALKELRANTKYDAVPIIVLTTSSNSTDKEIAWSLGANGFFNKPVTYTELMNVIQKVAIQWHVFQN
ncbi:response regulator [Spirosoma arboris]|nr:response regulator [Spirosoma arboris]